MMEENIACSITLTATKRVLKILPNCPQATSFIQKAVKRI